MSPGINKNSRTAISYYWATRLLKMAMSVYKWSTPGSWNKRYFQYTLYNWGYCSVIYTAKYGWIPQRCGLNGYDIFETPNHIIVNNPFLYNIDRKIGEGCVLFKLNPDYSSIADTINFYAMNLAEMSITLYANLVNTKISYVLTAEDKGQRESMKKLIDQILNGSPAVITKDTNVGNWQYFSQNVKQNYIVSELLIDMRKMLNQFNTEVGIPNTNTEKKERMLTDEIVSNNGETNAIASMRLEDFKETCKMLNNIAGESIMTVDWNSEVVGGDNIVLPSNK